MTKKSEKTQTTKSAAKTTKIAAVMGLLKRPKGATLEEIGKATGWQPHSIRAALTGLRKKDHTIDKSKRGEVTCYRIVGSAK